MLMVKAFFLFVRIHVPLRYCSYSCSKLLSAATTSTDAMPLGYSLAALWPAHLWQALRIHSLKQISMEWSCKGFSTRLFLARDGSLLQIDASFVRCGDF